MRDLAMNALRARQAPVSAQIAFEQAQHCLIRQKGVSLLEIITYLGIAAVVVTGALALYGIASSEQKTTQTVTEYQSIRAAIKSLYQGQAYPTDNLLRSLINLKRLPSTLSESRGNVTNAFGGSVEVRGDSPATGRNSFYISYTRVPKEVCASMLVTLTKTRDWGWYNVSDTNSSPVGEATAITSPFTVAEAERQCDQDENRVTLWAR